MSAPPHPTPSLSLVFATPKDVSSSRPGSSRRAPFSDLSQDLFATPRRTPLREHFRSSLVCAVLCAGTHTCILHISCRWTHTRTRTRTHTGVQYLCPPITSSYTVSVEKGGLCVRYASPLEIYTHTHSFPNTLIDPTSVCRYGMSFSCLIGSIDATYSLLVCIYKKIIILTPGVIPPILKHLNILTQYIYITVECMWSVCGESWFILGAMIAQARWGCKPVITTHTPQ